MMRRVKQPKTRLVVSGCGNIKIMNPSKAQDILNKDLNQIENVPYDEQHLAVSVANIRQLIESSNIRLIHINGGSYTGKTAIGKELERLGETVIHADGWVSVRVKNGSGIVVPHTFSKDQSQYVIHPERLLNKLKEFIPRVDGGGVIYVIGSCSNWKELINAGMADLTYILTISRDELERRFQNVRPDNPYGSNESDREIIRRQFTDKEVITKQFADNESVIIMDANVKIDELARNILKMNQTKLS